jgi:hypothetical protein
MNTGIPKTESEAAMLRAYIPSETLTHLAEIQREENKQADKRSRRFYELVARESAIKERMRQDRLELKKLTAQKTKHFETPLFPRSDAARQAAWMAAVEARAAALARGESPRFESAAECGARTNTHENETQTDSRETTR